MKLRWGRNGWLGLTIQFNSTQDHNNFDYFCVKTILQLFGIVPTPIAFWASCMSSLLLHLCEVDLGLRCFWLCVECPYQLCRWSLSPSCLSSFKGGVGRLCATTLNYDERNLGDKLKLLFVGWIWSQCLWLCGAQIQ